MVVIIHYEVDDLRRRALRHRTGQKGLATRREILNECLFTLDNLFNDYLTDYEAAQRVEREQEEQEDDA
jgi:hypothetical protein